MRSLFALSLAALFAGAPAAVAQEQDRFTLERTEDGFVRLDNRTGRMSVCEERGSQLVCRAAAAERAALEGDLDALQARIDDLERRLATLERTGPAVTAPGLPSDADFERTLGFMERFFRRFMDIVKDLDKDMRGTEPETDPQRT